MSEVQRHRLPPDRVVFVIRSRKLREQRPTLPPHESLGPGPSQHRRAGIQKLGDRLLARGDTCSRPIGRRPQVAQVEHDRNLRSTVGDVCFLARRRKLAEPEPASARFIRHTQQGMDLREKGHTLGAQLPADQLLPPRIGAGIHERSGHRPERLRARLQREFRRYRVGIRSREVGGVIRERDAHRLFGERHDIHPADGTRREIRGRRRVHPDTLGRRVHRHHGDPDPFVSRPVHRPIAQLPTLGGGCYGLVSCARGRARDLPPHTRDATNRLP